MKIALDRNRIEDFCRRWKISELSLFGSVLRDDFRSDSDVDVLVSFERDARWSLFDFMDMEEELAELIGRRIDLVSRAAIEESSNYIRRRRILESAEPFYVAR